MGISWNNREVTGIYDKARKVPDEILTDIFAEIFEKTGFSGKRCRILDAGCGTGRITFPLAKTFTNLEIRGIDISGQMLSLLEGKIKSSGISNYATGKANLLELNEPARAYAFSVISSVLHSIRDWRTAVDNIVDATGEYLALVSETSDMYSLVLNRQDRGNGLLERFWGEYSRLREKHSLPGADSTQVGIKWQLGCPEVMEHLEERGAIESRFEVSRSWTLGFTVGDLAEIVEKKAYSSMFAADEEAYARVASDLKGWLKKERMQNSERVKTNNDIRVDVVKLASRVSAKKL